MYDDAAVHEFPFAPERRPARLAGKAAIAAYLKNLPAVVQIDSFEDLRVREAGDELIVEATARGRRPGTGAPFHMLKNPSISPARNDSSACWNQSGAAMVVMKVRVRLLGRWRAPRTRAHVSPRAVRGDEANCTYTRTMIGTTLHAAARSLLALLALNLLGCTSVVGDIVGSITVTCSTTSDAGGGACVITKNAPSSEQSTIQNDCTNEGGKIVTACPTQGLVGCCTQSEVEVSVESCSYAGNAAELKSECGSGTWSTSE
jgi:hypothetical protein